MKPGKFIRSLAFVLTALVPFFAASASADTLSDIKQRGSIVVGVDFTHPPYGMYDQNALQTGTDYDIAKLIAQDLGVKLQLVPVNGPNRVPFLLTNKLDIVIASFTITDDRKKVISFSRPYATEPTLILAPGKDSIKTIADLSGKTVAVARGNTADLELESLIKEKDVKDVNIVRYLDEATARTAVSSGQQSIYAAALADALAVKQASPSSHFEFQFQMSEDPLGIGLRKDDIALQQWLDNWVKGNLQNGKLNAIWVKYFGMPLSKSLYQGV
jgi:polar amino acid transport system substrate-binding protein